jgi:hypothetical protein
MYLFQASDIITLVPYEEVVEDIASYVADLNVLLAEEYLIEATLAAIVLSHMIAQDTLESFDGGVVERSEEAVLDEVIDKSANAICDGMYTDTVVIITLADGIINDAIDSFQSRALETRAEAAVNITERMILNELCDENVLIISLTDAAIDSCLQSAKNRIPTPEIESPIKVPEATPSYRDIPSNNVQPQDPDHNRIPFQEWVYLYIFSTGVVSFTSLIAIALVLMTAGQLIIVHELSFLCMTISK